jgi:hypothetical protein
VGYGTGWDIADRAGPVQHPESGLLAPQSVVAIFECPDFLHRPRRDRFGLGADWFAMRWLWRRRPVKIREKLLRGLGPRARANCC